MFFVTAVTRPGGKAFFTFEAQFPVSGCFGGLHLACDCFAVLLCNFFFTAFLRAVHATDNFFSVASSKFAVTVALPIESLPPRFFLGWPKQRAKTMENRIF